MKNKSIALMLCFAMLLWVISVHAAGFSDVKPDCWYACAVEYALEQGLMNGVAPERFDPQASLTRGMFVTILGRMEGIDPEDYPGSSFSDVAQKKWYSAHVQWASEKGIVDGYGDGLFGTDDPVTREQMATMLWRYLEYKRVTLRPKDEPEKAFRDEDKVSGWAKEGVQTMHRTGLISGDPDGSFRPQDTASRAEAAAVFMRLHLALKPMAVEYSFYESTDKVMEDEPLAAAATHTLRLAKNESEGVQLAFTAAEEGQYRISFSGFENQAGALLRSEVYREEYIPCENEEAFFGRYPDALVPLSDPVLSLKPGQNTVLYIRVWADGDTPAGAYSACVTLTAADGSSLRIPVQAQIWGFTLPETPSTATAFGASAYWAEEYGCDYKQLYDMLLEHKISAYDLPYDVLDPRADAYMSDPRVTSFIVPCDNVFTAEGEAYARACFEKLSADPVWAEKAIFYLVDEPKTKEQYEFFLASVARLEELYPGFHMVMPTGLLEFEDGGEVFDVMGMHQLGVDVFCPLTRLFGEGMTMDWVRRQLPDARYWWYVCCDPREDYCNFQTDMEGIRARLLLWQQYELGIEGLLYWTVTNWGETDPWESAMSTPSFDTENFGDGVLVYPGGKVGCGEALPSLRLEIITDGIEDYDYLTLAAEAFGEAYVEEKLALVTAGLTDYTLDDSLLRQVRDSIGADLEAALGQP